MTAPIRRRRRRLGGALAVLLAAAVLAAAVALSRAPIDPLAYFPPPAPPLAGPYAPNEALRAAERLAAGRLRGPEDVAVDAAGRIIAGAEDGRLVRVTLEAGGGERIDTLADTGGRPLGLDFAPDGHLIVADARRGLLAVSPQGGVRLLVHEAAGRPLGFADDVDVARDGTVYFSDASWRHGVDAYLLDLLEARPHGRLLRHDPATGETEVLLDGLYFANGVALSADESFVLVNETYRYRITRYWLTGPRAGTRDVFADNLPGFPDGVSGNGRGLFWVALYTVRNAVADRLHPHPRWKALLSTLPRSLWPRPADYGLVLGLDESGRVVHALHDPGGRVVNHVTSVEEVDGWLHLGSLDGDAVARLPVPGPRGR
ncbi:MAG TPA: SMP-30/gluconolactonase/LRE family protein [Thermoanaerobaculia bacterium]